MAAPISAVHESRKFMGFAEPWFVNDSSKHSHVHHIELSEGLYGHHQGVNIVQQG